ncbi:OmpP1/FadL family transporter [Shewanella pneumatophori]|uniref:OmpP1/FadL family transporter n=1 Tax=Shewanella pneumatophori TaxID=314092 RepID=A0A9X1ZK13_9GAMM|nr:outer membrane protein transport protein [Shewanella pneumatophori]MCL1139213.1 OmpP1/FadL family transporter [Shewanella pneumatophori]
MKYFNKTLIAVSVALASTQTMAAGFQLNSQSATGIGRAFAGDAVIADNASVLARNPAAMAMFDDKAISVGMTYADVTVEVQDANWTRPPLETVEYGHVANAAEGKVIPNAYYIQPINDTFAFGLAAFSNYGTGTDTSDLTAGGNLPVPGDLVGNTEVTTVNFNASVSARINDQWSVGLGLDIIHGEGVLTRDGQTVLTGPNSVNFVDVEADGIGFGGIVGVTYEMNANNRFGLSYRFSPDIEAEGTLNRLGTEYDELTVPLADIAQFAGFHQLTDAFAVHYTAQWTQWSNFTSVDLHDNNGTTVLKEYQWNDSWFLSAGVTYQLDEKMTLRAGIAYDQGVVGDIESISIPDSDRNWFTAGATYKLNKHSSVDFGYAYVTGRDTEVTEKSLGGLNGTLTATTSTGANYFSLAYNYQF